jgi:hypothetical protein
MLCNGAIRASSSSRTSLQLASPGYCLGHQQDCCLYPACAHEPARNGAEDNSLLVQRIAVLNGLNGICSARPVVSLRVVSLPNCLPRPLQQPTGC